MTVVEPRLAGERPTLRLLDGFALTIGAERVTLTSSAQRVIGYLAVRGTSVRRDALAGHLWPLTTQPRAQASLRTALWRLRRAHPLLVTSTHDAVRVHDELAVDLVDFQRLTSRLLEPPADDDPAWSAAALGLLRWDLLPDWDEDWVLLERERMRQLRIHALEALSRRLTGAGRHGAAIEAAYAAIAAEPLRESARSALIEAELAEGNRTGALRDLAEYRALLRRELGLDPSPHLEALVRAAVPGAVPARP
jgi:DNA-binding SARP family transcriptional activator